MRFHSTPESALNGEITKLAIIECFVSVAIYMAIGLYLGTFRWLAMAVVVAPLMLFRTEASSDWGLRVYERYSLAISAREKRRSDSFGTGVLFIIEGPIGVPIAGIFIRIIAALYWAVRTPLKTVSEMPQNWLRQALCTDFLHAPEILPLEASKGERLAMPTFARVLGAIGSSKTWGPGAALVAVLPLLLVGYLPSLIYRISFKATAVAYLPIIWAAHVTLRNPMPAKMRLQRITKGELEKVRRALSGVIMATLVAKFGFVLSLVDWSRIEERFPSKRLVQSLVVPEGWPWWQMTLGADALLTFFLFLFADAALARLNRRQGWREGTVLGTVSTVSFLRAVLSLITISHFFRIALVAVAPGPLHRLLAG